MTNVIRRVESMCWCSAAQLIIPDYHCIVCMVSTNNFPLERVLFVEYATRLVAQTFLPNASVWRLLFTQAGREARGSSAFSCILAELLIMASELKNAMDESCLA